MAAMEVFLGTLVGGQRVPLTNDTGGTSVSNPYAGWNSSNVQRGRSILVPATVGDRGGRGF
jgi:mannan endo-1,6-alpha-mannosidase